MYVFRGKEIQTLDKSFDNQFNKSKLDDVFEAGKEN
jgi:hypothetical protein